MHLLADMTYCSVMPHLGKGEAFAHFFQTGEVSFYPLYRSYVSPMQTRNEENKENRSGIETKKQGKTIKKRFKT